MACAKADAGIAARYVELWDDIAARERIWVPLAEELTLTITELVRLRGHKPPRWDAVCGGQSWHWLHPRAAAEARCLLVAGGTLLLCRIDYLPLSGSDVPGLISPVS